MQNVDTDEGYIDYCLHILGVRVRAKSCQLIAKGAGGWEPIGPTRELPLEVLSDTTSCAGTSTDTLLLTVLQYTEEHPESDLCAVLAQKKD